MKTLVEIIQEKLIINKNLKIRSKNKENWSIKTAQDGDVVAWHDGSFVFIYKCLHKELKNKLNSAGDNAIVYHVVYHTSIKKIDIGPDTGVSSIDFPQKFRLATDKECDDLYYALENAGYEWDNIKKEIVKI